MATKKIKIDKSNLPLINLNNEYYVRYRIVSNKTKTSDWSEILVVDGKPVSIVDGVTTVSTSGSKKLLGLVWENTNASPTYDVFVKWGSEDYVYHGSSISTSYSIIAPTGATSAEVTVQIGSAQKRISDALKVFEDSVTL
jgi:hypothetical protein